MKDSRQRATAKKRLHVKWRDSNAMVNAWKGQPSTIFGRGCMGVSPVLLRRRNTC